jgi:lipopolysaccharide/colanic/teichoic acid biosynthesis glycosyltransferase
MYLNSEVDGPRWASEYDSRVTPIGKILRRTRLDELPQLWNVVKGEMGFFGPRPERPEIHNALRKDIPLFNMRTIVRPGITGWAQVCAGYAASVEESRLKLEYDLYYIQHMSLRLDLIILMKTIRVALFGDKASQTPDAAPAAKVGEIAGPAGVKTPQTY